MPNPDIYLVSCSHMIDSQGRSKTGVLMADSNVLNLCETCYTIMQSDFMHSLVKEALMEVFDKQVASAMNP